MTGPPRGHTAFRLKCLPFKVRYASSDIERPVPAARPRGDTAMEELIKESFKAEPGGRLAIDTFSGLIVARGWDAEEVEVKMLCESRASGGDDAHRLIRDLDMSIKKDGNAVAVKVANPGKRRGVSLAFIVSVPRSFNADLKTSGGSVTATDIAGEVRARTSGGGLTLARIRGPVNLETSGGSIDIRAVEGDVDMRTSGGSISAEQVQGRLVAKTSGGSIRLIDVCGAIQAETSGGAVAARFPSPLRADCDLRTSAGSIMVEIDDSTGFDLDAEARGGETLADFDGLYGRRTHGRSLVAAINGGGPRLTMRTSSGSIHVTRLPGQADRAAH